MRKNILVIGHNYDNPFLDVCNQYARIFDPSLYSVTVIYLTGPEDQTVKNRTLGEAIFLDLSLKQTRGLKISGILKLNSLMKAKHFEFVICHRYKPAYLMLWLAKWISIKHLICVMHELKAMESYKRKFWITLALQKNITLAGVSDAVRDDMRKDLWWIDPKRIITLHNVIDIEQSESMFLTRKDAREALQISDETFLFANLARLVVNKDQATLLHAFAFIKNDCPKAKLLIAGKGEKEIELKQLAKNLRLENAVIFTGYLQNGISYMKAFDTFILSSTQEAFGRVLIEAMLAKVPVIGTIVHGIPEIIQSVGRLVPAKDPHSLARAMRELYSISCNDRRTLSESSYHHVVQHFSINPFKERFMRLFSL